MDRYLIHIATGGITHMLCALGVDLLYCHSYGRKCVVISKNHPAFQLKLADIFNINTDLIVDANAAKPLYEDLQIRYPSLPAIDDLQCEWTNNNWLYRIKGLSRTDDGAQKVLLPVGDCNLSLMLSVGFYEPNTPKEFNWLDGLRFVLKLLSINDSIKKIIHDHQCALPSEYIGVHYRNSDKANNIDQLIDIIRKKTSETNIFSVYWASDDFNSLQTARNNLPNCEVLSGTNSIDFRRCGLTNLHYITSRQLQIFGTDRMSLIVDFFGDILSLAKSTYFLPSPNTDIRHLVEFCRADLSCMNFLAD